MAYDKAKAHEYYEKYRKKGLKKGRKKGSGKKKTSKAKKPKQENLVGLSSAGLNDKGKMQAAMIKANLKTEMNEALSKAETPEEKVAIRMEYQNKALEEISKLKSNPDTAQPKKQKATKEKSSKSSGKSSSSKSESKSTSKTAARDAAIAEATKQAQMQIDQIVERVKNMTPEEKETAKLKIEDVIKEIEQIQTTLAATTTAITAAFK